MLNIGTPYIQYIGRADCRWKKYNQLQGFYSSHHKSSSKYLTMKGRNAGKSFWIVSQGVELFVIHYAVDGIQDMLQASPVLNFFSHFLNVLAEHIYSVDVKLYIFANLECHLSSHFRCKYPILFSFFQTNRNHSLPTT